jgi:hypothetical protein
MLYEAKSDAEKQAALKFTYENVPGYKEQYPTFEDYMAVVGARNKPAVPPSRGVTDVAADLGKAFAGGAVGSTADTLRGVDWVAGKVGQIFGGEGKPGTMTEWADFLGQVQKENLTPEAQGFIYDLASGAGSMASFVLPGWGVGGAGAKLAGTLAARGLPRVAQGVARGAGFATGTGLEAAAEGGGTLREMPNATPEERDAATAKTMLANAALLAATNKLSGIYDIATGARRPVGKAMLHGGVFEGAQEGGQNFIQDWAQGKPLDPKAAGYEAVIGGVLGAATGGLGAAVNNRALVKAEEAKAIEDAKRQQAADAARENVAPLYDEAAGAASDAKQQALSDLDGIIADLAGQPKPAPAAPAPFQEVGAGDPAWDGPKRLDLSDRNVLGRVPNAQWWNQQHGIYSDPAEDFTNPATEQALAALQQQERQRFDRGLPIPRPDTIPATVPGPEAQRALEGADRAALPVGEGGRPMLPYGGQDFGLVADADRNDRVPARLVDSPVMPQAPRAAGLPIQPTAFQDIQDQATALPYQPGVTDLGEMPPSERLAPAAAGGDRVDALIAGVNEKSATPQTDLILDKSGKPFKDKTINLAVANSIKRGKNVEAVQIGPNQWGMRPVTDAGPKTGGKKQRAAIEKELAAVQHQGYDAMRDKAEAMIDAGQDVDVVYDVLAGMEETEAAPVQEAPKVEEKPAPSKEPWQMTKAEFAAYNREMEMSARADAVRRYEDEIARLEFGDRPTSELEAVTWKDRPARIAQLKGMIEDIKGRGVPNKNYDFFHKLEVDKAVAAGKEVPENVRAEYAPKASRWDIFPVIDDKGTRHVGDISQATADEINSLGFKTKPSRAVLRQENVDYIEKQHGDQLKPEDIALIQETVANPSEVLPNIPTHEGPGRADRILLVKQNGKAHVAIVEVSANEADNTVFNFWKMGKKAAEGYLRKYREEKVKRQSDLGGRPHESSIAISTPEGVKPPVGLSGGQVDAASGKDIITSEPESKGQKKPRPIQGNDVYDLNRGDILKDSSGKEYAFWSQRHGVMEVHPIENGKPVINADSGVRVNVDDVAKARNPEYRSDDFFRATKAEAKPEIGRKFGQEIGGSRYDKAQKRLTVEDMADMTEREREAINAAFDKFFQTVKTKETEKGVALFSRKGNVPTNSDGEITDASRELESAIAKRFNTEVPAGTFRQVRPDQTPQPASARITERIAREIFHKEPVFYTTSNPDLAPGGVAVPGSDRVFIAADSSDPHLFLLGHETLHYMKLEHEDLYTRLVHDVLPHVDQTRYRELANKEADIWKEQGDAHTKEGIRQEVLADFMGEQFTKNDFWRRLASKEPSIFTKVAGWVREKIDVIISKFNPWRAEVESVFTDLQAARMALTEVTAEYARRLRSTAQQEAFAKYLDPAQEVPANGRITADTKRFERLLATDQKVEIPEGTFTDVTDALVSGSPMARLAKKIGEKFGHRVVFFANARPEEFLYAGGVVRGSDLIFLDGQARLPHLYVLGHELGHALREKSPDTYRQMIADLKEHIAPQEFNALFEQEKKVYAPGEDVAMDELMEEVFGNIIGDQMTRRPFWEGLAQRSPKVFREIASWLKRNLDKVVKQLSGFERKTETAFKDVKKAREIISRALDEYAKAGGGKQGVTGEEGVKLKRTPAAQEARDRFGIALDPAGKKFDGRRVKNDIYAKFVHQQQPLIDAMDDKGEREAMERAISTSIRGSGSKVAEILERFGEIVSKIGGGERTVMFYEAIRKFQREEDLATSRPEYLAQDYRANVRSLNAMLRQATSPQDKALIRDAIKAHKEMYKRQVKGISLQHARQQLADIRAEIGPVEFSRLEHISREHRDFEQNAIIERLHNEGIMSDDAYQKITGAPEYQFYSALQREMDDRTVQALGAKEVVKRFKGSDRMSISSVDATIANIQRTEQLIGRNRVARMLTNDIRKLTPDLQAAIRQIPVNSEKYAPADAVVVFVGGKKQFWKVPEDIRIALEGVNEPEMNLVMKALSIPSKILRAGATLSFEFMARNPIRDQFTAFIFSKHGYIPFWDMAKGFASLIKKDAVFHEWRQDGGDNAFLVALDRDSKNQQARELLGLPKDWKGQVKHYVTSPLQLLQDISAFAERGTRLGAYKRARTTLDKQGVALDQAREMAAHESREITLDFGRMGYQGRAVNQIVAFWNANLQDIDKLQRTMRERPGQTMLKMTLGLMLPSLLLWMANKDDEDYQQLPIWLRNLFWNFKVPGSKEFISLPKPFLPGAVFGTFLGEAVPELLTRGDKKFAGEALKNIGSNLMAVPFPTAAKPIVEWWANYSFFRNAPIENQSMQRLPEGMRVRTGTSDVIAAMGRMTDISPLKLENTWRGVTGGLGRTVTDVADYAMKKAVGSEVADPAKKWWEVTPVVKGFVRPEPIGSGGRALDDFFDNMDTARQAKGGYQALVKSGNKDEAKAFMAENKAKMLLASAYESASRDLSKLREAAAAVRRDKSMSAEAKREKLDMISRRMSKIAMRTNDLWNKRVEGR